MDAWANISHHVDHKGTSSIPEAIRKRDVYVNLDSLEALLLRKFPDREHASRESLASMVDELRECGCNTIDDVAHLLDEQRAAADAHEMAFPPPGADGRFLDVGVLRTSLTLRLEGPDQRGDIG